MLPIYICDDQKEHLHHVQKIIEKFIFIEEFDMRVVCTASTPEELLAQLHESPALYFLDVELQGSMDGFQLAEEIRKKDPRGFLVFITTHEELSYLTFRYRVEAMDYILKEDTQEFPERILGCMKKAEQLLSSANNKVHKILCVNEGRRKIFLNQEEIYCIKTCSIPHKIKVYTEQSVYEFTNSLREVKEQLDERFVLVHKSCIVNLEHVECLHRNERILLLRNGQQCTVSVRMLGSLSKSLKLRT